jgi:cobalt-zinc-cadmium resistance protein CzcA
MIAKLIEASIRNRLLVIFGVLLMAAIGLRALQRLPIDAVPDVTNVQVQVLTNAPALGPLEVEQFITVPVESVMSGLPRLAEVRSVSKFGLSAVTVVFEEGTDIYFARQLVAERLPSARAAVPAGYGTPEMGPISTGLGEIVQFELRNKEGCKPAKKAQQAATPRCYSQMELRTILDWYVAFQLRAVKGVVEVNTYGGHLKTYEVQLEPMRLSAFGISLKDVYEALHHNNANAGGAYLRRAGEQVLIRGEGLVRTLDDIRRIVVSTRKDGTPITVAQLGRVATAPMVRQGAVTRDGRGETVIGIAMMLMGENSRTVSARVNKRLDELRTTLPPGVEIDVFYDRTELVDRTIRTVATNLIEGGVLVIVVLLLLLGNVRGGLLVASAIPLSMLAAFIAMNAFSVSGNLMSLGAIDFGLIVDGSVVMVEAAVRTLAEKKARGPQTAGAVLQAAKEVGRPVAFAVGIIVLVYIPIFSLGGIEGKMFHPMALTVVFALAASLVLAVTWVPAMSSWIFRGGVSERETFFVRKARALYAPALRAVVRRPKLTFGAAVLTFLCSLFAVPYLGAEFVPTLDEGAIAIQATRLTSVSLEESIEATTRIEATLLEHFPSEVRTVVSKTGRPEIATDPMGIELTDIAVELKPISGWTKARSKAELVAKMTRVLQSEVPGQAYSFSQPIELRTNELISGVRSDVAISIYGEDLEVLKRVGNAIVRVVSKIPGGRDVKAEQVTGLPFLRVIVDRNAIARYGVNAEDVLDAVSAMGGWPVGEVFEGQKRFTLQIRYAKRARSSLSAIRSIPIRGSKGALIPLGQLARLRIEDGPAQISRDNIQRRLTVEANVRGRDLASFVTEAKAAIAKAKVVPPNYFLTWGGQFENLEAAVERLKVAVPLALLLIFILLYMTYGDVRPALLIYMNVPVAATGGILALLIRGMPFSISAAVGFIALFGVAVLNGVVLLSFIIKLQREGVATKVAAVEGALVRLRPVMMTALVASLGFLPMALSRSAGAEVQRPLATVVIGGLITSTLLTLLVLPAAYAWLSRKPAVDGAA